MWKYLLLWLAVAQCNVYCERTKDKMYIPIKGFHCFRRLNGTHSTGCASPVSGAKGVIHFVNSNEDIDFLLNNPPAPPYSPVIPAHLFTRQNALRLNNDNQGYIASIVLIDSKTIGHFSNELRCPNQYSNIKSEESCDPEKLNTTWNPLGTGLLHEDFRFPILYVRDTEEVEKMRSCFEKFNNIKLQNNNRVLCSIKINAFMAAAVSTEVCVRRTNYVNNLNPPRYCDPFQGKNIFSTLYPKENKNIKKYILISSRIDTTSMFSDIGLGAMGSLIPFSVLINVAHVLSNIFTREMQNDMNILFMVFNGEAYDYIGSQRFVYDLKTGNKSPTLSGISLENIELMIDIGWIDDISNMALYHVTDLPHFNNLQKYLNDYSKKFDLGVNVNNVKTANLPPTSAQSFLRENLTFPVVILSSKLNNRFYHSIYDDETNIKYEYKNTTEDFTQLTNETASDFEADSIQIKIRNISATLALSVYQLIMKSEYTESKLANPVLADELLFCYLNSTDCPLFKAAFSTNSFPFSKNPPLRYVSVQGSPTHEATAWAIRVLGLLTGRRVPNAQKENCSTLPLYWFAGYTGKGECRLTTHNLTDALSPAFLEKDYDWKSGKYSTWTESTWPEFGAKIYLRPPYKHDIISLSIGSAVTALFIVITVFSNVRSNILFNNIVTVM